VTWLANFMPRGYLCFGQNNGWLLQEPIGDKFCRQKNDWLLWEPTSL